MAIRSMYKHEHFADTFPWLSILLVSAFLLHICAAVTIGGGPRSSPPLDAVTLKLKWHHQFQAAGYYAAKEKGFYKDAGLDVTILPASKVMESIDAVLNGTAEFGVGASDLVIARAKGKPVVALAVTFQHSPLVLLVREDSGIKHVHDLIKKRVMLEPHSDELVAYLRREGVRKDQLNLVPHSFDPTPLIEGEVDAMSAYVTDEPFALAEAGIKFLVFSPRSSGIDFYGDTLFTVTDQVRNHRERVDRFERATRRGWTYAFEHVDEMVEIIKVKYHSTHSREHLKYEAAQAKKLIMPDVVEVGYMNPGRWRHIAATYAELGMIPEDTSLDGFLYDPNAPRMIRTGYAIFAGFVIPIFLLVLIIGAQFARTLTSELAKRWKNSPNGVVKNRAVR